MVIEKARQAVRAGGFVGLTAAMLPAFLARMKATTDVDRQAVRDRWVGRWARTLLRLFAIEVVVIGEVPRATRGRLVVSNHRSAIDIGVMLSTFGGTMVSRGDLANWPVLGAAARAVNTVFVDRADAKSGAATIRTIQKHLEARQVINLFPEGTTFQGDEVRPFFGGAFVSAVRAEAEILPVGIAYPSSSAATFHNETFPEHLSRMAKGKGTRMVVCPGTPFIVKRGDRATDVNRRAHAEVSALVVKARAACGP